MAGIGIITNFDVNTPAPIDSRMVVTNEADKYSISFTYEGLIVYVTTTNKLWMLTDATNFNNSSGWTEVGAGGSGAGFPFSGSAVITGSLVVTGSAGITGSLVVTEGITGNLTGIASNVAGGTTNRIPLWTGTNTLGDSIIYQSTNAIGINTTSPIANLDVRTNTNLTTESILRVYGSGSSTPLSKVEGSQGELMSVTDNISGSLFSVNDISGLPIIDVISDGTILLGNYAAQSLNTTVKMYKTSTTQSLYLIPTASYDAVFVEYSYTSGSNYGAGYWLSKWFGSTVQQNRDIRVNNGGDPTFNTTITGSYASLNIQSVNNGYLIKAIIRAI